jgi:two-component system NtrC family sensor kinase
MDPDRMRRVLINIASNARDAMPKGGTFTITTRQCGDRWELSLHDTGTGIPPQLRSRIFKPFVTFGKEHGTGLGLAIVREIVEAHGGTIQVQSKVSGEDGSETSGTTFIVSLPIYPAGCRRQTQD